MPPLHQRVVTATVKRRPARRQHEPRAGARRRSTTRYALDAAGLGVTLAWGLPYFDRLRRRAGEVPICRSTTARASRRCCRPPLPERPARRRSSRRTTSRSCCAATAARTSTTRARRCSTTCRTSTMTSIRRGFAGGGFDGKQSLPKKMAMAAGVPGADLIPDTSELFLGFTSTQKAGLGPRPDREPRDARVRRPPRRLLPRRHAHAPLAHRRGPRGVVPQLRLRRACARRCSVPG